ncbi:unnamed protein product [Colias eurytheme]|nr:unnamed protein product [Colias eurytheme]
MTLLKNTNYRHFSLKCCDDYRDSGTANTTAEGCTCNTQHLADAATASVAVVRLVPAAAQCSQPEEGTTLTARAAVGCSSSLTLRLSVFS